MARNTKKTEVMNDYDTSDRYENAHNTVIKETITQDNSPILNKILVCLYIIIALLAINVVISALKGTNWTLSSGSGDDNGNETGTPTVNETAEYDVSNFKTITPDEFVEAYKGDKLQLIYIGRENCGFCVKFVPVLNEAQKNYNFKTLYLDINTANNSVNPEGMNKIIELNEEFFTGENTSYGITPMTLIVKNGEIIDYQIGYSEYSTLEALVSKHFDKK